MTTELTKAAPNNHGPIYETDLYDFAGWLTTRPGVMAVGSRCEAGPMAEAVGEYIKTFPERFALTQRPAAQTEREASKATDPIPTPAPPFATYDEHGLGCDDAIQDFYYLHCQEVETRAFNRGFDAASLPAPRQTTPAQEPGVFREYFDAHRALIAAKGVSERASHAHIVGYRAPSHSTGSEPYAASVARNDQLKRADDAARCARKEAEARFNAALSAAQSATQQATPEPVGGPVYQYQRGDESWIDVEKHVYGHHKANSEGGTRVLYTNLAPVETEPEGFALAPLTDRELDAAIDKAKAETMYGTHHSGYWRDIGRSVLAAAKAKGGEA